MIILLGPHHELALEQLRARVSSHIILALPAFEELFALHNNTSKLGAGAALVLG